MSKAEKIPWREAGRCGVPRALRASVESGAFTGCTPLIAKVSLDGNRHQEGDRLHEGVIRYLGVPWAPVAWAWRQRSKGGEAVSDASVVDTGQIAEAGSCAGRAWKLRRTDCVGVTHSAPAAAHRCA